MAVRIKLRRDTAANWATNNPVLLSGEIGIETDTLKIKVGDGYRAWNSITSYAFKPGQANGVATLNSAGKIPAEQLPDTSSISIDFQNVLNAISTSSIPEGSNKYFTSQRAIDAVSSQIAQAILDASNDATSKANAAEAVAALDATSKANAAKADAALIAKQYTDDEISLALSSISTEVATLINEAINEVTNSINNTIDSEVSSLNTSISNEAVARSNAINTAISNEIVNRNIAIESSIDAITTADVQESSNLYFTNQRAKNAVASDIATAIAGASFSLSSKTTDDLAEGSTNKYFTSARAVAANNNKFTELLIYVDDSIDGLRTEVANNLSNTTVDYIPISDINMPYGVAGLDGDSKIQDSAVPSTVAKLAGASFTGDVSTTNLTVTGNLTVNGTTTTVNTTNLELTDPMIYLGSGSTGNSNDIGIVGHFTQGTYQHTGLVRDASDGKWKLFSNVPTEPSNSTLDFTSAVYDTLKIGGLEASSATIGSVTNTELQYVHGVTSAIQTQINSKAPIASPTFTGTVTIPAGANISGYLKSDVAAATYMPINVDISSYIDTSGWLTTADAATTYLKISDAPSEYLSILNAADLYLSKSDAASVYATINNPSFTGSISLPDSSITNSMLNGMITSDKLAGNIENSKLTNYSITLNGTSVDLGGTLTLNTGYISNSNTSSNNKISYGTSSTPDISSPTAGDIYIELDTAV